MPRKFSGKCFECGGLGHKATDHQFTGQCFECGGWGHKAIDHQKNVIDQPELVSESEDGQSAGSERQGRVAIYSFPDDHQTHPQPQEQAFGRRFGGKQEGTGGDTHFGVAHKVTEATLPGLTEDFKKRTGTEDPLILFLSAEAGLEIEHIVTHSPDAATAQERIMDSLSTMQYVDIAPGRVSGRSNGSMPVQPQGQAGHGSLPGSRVAQTNRAEASVPGNNYQIQKPGMVRGHGQQPRQMTRRDKRRIRAAVHQEEEDTDEILNQTGFLADRGQQNPRRRGGERGGMTGERELANRDAQASHPDATGEPPIGNGSSSGDRRQRDPSIHCNGPEYYQVGTNEVVGHNLSTDDVHALIDRFVRERPQGKRFSIELLPNPVKDSSDSGPVINGLKK